MGAVAAGSADVVIVTSDNPRSEDPRRIVDEITRGLDTDVEVELDRTHAIARAIETARAGDVVLLAGKGHEQGQEVAGTILPFDDREIARQVLRRLAARA
jgi:UDP-N-acetylmuramoyl-L-alanyl-D-glutamate--2,6-diaminopimelate ligase